MSRTRRYAALLGFVAGLAVLAGTLPATWTTAAINAACADRCRLAEPTGRWWQGTARLYVKAERWLPLGTVAWHPAWRGGPGILARMGVGEAAIRWTGTQFETTLRGVTLPAELFMAQPALRLPRAGWGGVIEIATLQVNWTPHGHAAAGTLRWRHASTTALDDLPLGEFGARLTVRDGELAMNVTGAPGNALDAALQLNVAAQGRLTLHGTVAATGEPAARLAPVLRTFALPDGTPGRYRVDIR